MLYSPENTVHLRLILTLSVVLVSHHKKFKVPSEGAVSKAEVHPSLNRVMSIVRTEVKSTVYF